MTDKDDIVVTLVDDALYDAAMAVRNQVFVNELKIPATKEFDGNDRCSAHVLAYMTKGDDIIPIGTMRIRFFAGFVKFERMAVVKEFRKTDVSDRIMHYGFDYVSAKGYRQVYGMCKHELLPRWQQCGYQPIEGAPLVEQNGMVLVPIMCPLSENSNALNICSSAELLNLPENKLLAMNCSAAQTSAPAIPANKTPVER